MSSLSSGPRGIPDAYRVGTGQATRAGYHHRMPLGCDTLQRRLVRRREYVCHEGQPMRALFLVHAGAFKISIVSADGREKITGFRFAGDALGLESLDLPAYACSVIALDIGELLEVPMARLHEPDPGLQHWLAGALAAEIRRDWGWMLTLGTLHAEQRVAAFLLDLCARMAALGFSARRVTLRMTRADIGSFLAINLETVTRILSRLQARGVIGVEGRQLSILDPEALRACVVADRRGATAGRQRAAPASVAGDGAGGGRFEQPRHAREQLFPPVGLAQQFELRGVGPGTALVA